VVPLLSLSHAAAAKLPPLNMNAEGIREAKYEICVHKKIILHSSFFICGGTPQREG